jgi:hypothetical protein
MSKKSMGVKLRFGHAGGHIRDTFIAAIGAFHEWGDGEPEPMVEFEINYKPIQISISKACGLFWNCTDILPGGDVYALELRGIEPKRRTYAGAAHALLDAIKEARAKENA